MERENELGALVEACHNADLKSGLIFDLEVVLPPELVNMFRSARTEAEYLVSIYTLADHIRSRLMERYCDVGEMLEPVGDA